MQLCKIVVMEINLCDIILVSITCIAFGCLILAVCYARVIYNVWITVLEVYPSL